MWRHGFFRRAASRCAHVHAAATPSSSSPAPLSSPQDALALAACRPVHSHRRPSRPFSSSSRTNENIAGWSSNVQTDDGRTFQFATVIVEDGSAADAPSAMWNRTCLLIGGSPTAAVAFVSQPTAAAMQAIAYFSERIGSGDGGLSSSSESPESGKEPPIPAIIGCVADEWSGYGGEFASAGRRGGLSGSGQDGRDGYRSWRRERENDDAVGQALATLHPLLSALGSSQTPRRLSGEQSTREMLKKALQAKSSATSGSDIPAGLAAGLFDKREDEWGPNRGEASNASVDWDDREAEVDEASIFETNEGDTPEDWLQLCNEYEEVVARGDEWSELLTGGETDDQNAIAEKGSTWGSDGVEAAVQNGRSKSVKEKASEREVEIEKSIRKSSHKRRQKSQLLKDVNYQEGDESVVGVAGRVVVGRGSRQTGDKEKFRLHLCAARMPGVCATAFVSPTPALPCLPNFRRAVLEDNPHMLIFGAPGFVYSEFMQRLTSVFPQSARAAVFLRPLFDEVANIKRGGLVEAGPSPLFYGPHVAHKGAVGLALSSDGKASKLPLAAFAEFVRMSLAFPRLPGQILLEDSISCHLFKPRFPPLILPPEIAPRSSPTRIAKANLLERSSAEKGGEDAAVKNWVEQLTPYLTKTKDGANAEGLENTSKKKYTSQMMQGQDNGLLPLAVFGTAPFPGWSSAYNIFEPKYQLLVRECVEVDRLCGIAALWPTCSGPTLVGCTATLRVKRFESDCRSSLVAHGRKRFRVAPAKVGVRPGSFGLNVAEVDYFDDEKVVGEAAVRELKNLAFRALSLCERVVVNVLQMGPKVGMRFANPWLLNNPVAASFAIAHVLPAQPNVKLRWLASTDTKMRLLEEMHFLKALAMP